MSNAFRKAALLPLLLAGGVQPALAAHAPAHEAVEPALGAGAAEEAQPLETASASERRVGPYRLLRPLGSGGMGTVHLAESSEPPRRVAIKVMREDRREPRFAARFEVERRALARVEHEGIVRLHESGVTEEGQPWLALELVEGEPLVEFCDRRRLDVDARLRLFADVCEAVQHLHEHGILHRDLKPANILVSARGVPKIIDLGLARLSDDAARPGDDCVMGTPAYMAPEQLALSVAELDARCDVYSLGVIMRELLVGASPRRHDALRVVPDGRPLGVQLRSLGGDAEKVAHERSANEATLRRRLRGPLDRIAQRALALERDARYDSADALHTDIERDLVRHATRGRFLRALALATVSAVAGGLGGWLAAAGS